MTVTQDTPQNPKKIAFTNGLLWAVINIIIFLLVYYAAPTLLGNFAWVAVQLLIGVGLAVYFVLDLRKKIGGYWTFREALGSIFITFLTQVVIVTLFTTAFAKWIEPAYGDTMREIILNNTTTLAEAIHTDQDQIDQMIEEAEKGLEKQINPDLVDIIQGLTLASLFYFIGALIFAAIFKRERPLFVPVSEHDEQD